MTHSAPPSYEDETARELCRNVSLLGGPLHRAARRLGLVRGTSNTFPAGVVIGVSLWLALAITAAALGAAGRLFAIRSIAIHVRLLVVIPLFFACETFFDPKVRGFFATLFDSGILPTAEARSLATSLARLKRRKDSWFADAVSMAVAGALLFDLPIAGFDQLVAASGVTVVQDALPVRLVLLAGVTVFRFLVFRWIWRLFLWGSVLWRLSIRKLRLVATHPDRTGGLGGLEGVQLRLLALVLAISATVAAATAADLASGAITFGSVYPLASVALVISLALVVIPILPFARVLLVCRQEGLRRYMTFATAYVDAFEKKWTQPGTPLDDLLGTPDLQSLADLGNSVSVVRQMRLLPVGTRLIAGVTLGTLLPQLPLLLFQYSLSELTHKFAMRLLGG